MQLPDPRFPLPSLIGPGVLAALADQASHSPPGCFVEVGVYKGGSAQYLWDVAKSQGRKLFLYDTFAGIPYQDKSRGDVHVVGDFKDATYEDVRAKFPPEVQIIKGLFPLSAASMPPIAFAHIDCDQYQAVREACEYLRPRLVSGGMLWFDDPDVLEGAKRGALDALGHLDVNSVGKFIWVKP